MWGKIMIPMYRLWLGYDYTAYMDYMDPDVRCPQNAVEFNHSLTHSLQYVAPLFQSGKYLSIRGIVNWCSVAIYNNESA